MCRAVYRLTRRQAQALLVELHTKLVLQLTTSGDVLPRLAGQGEQRSGDTYGFERVLHEN